MLLRVRDYMTVQVVTANLEDALDATVATMVECGFRHMPVLDADGKLFGMITDRDLRSAFPVEVESRVCDVMTPIPRTVFADDALSYALDLFRRYRFGALPVIDAEEHVIGILSVYDVLDAVKHMLDFREHRYTHAP